MGKIRQILLFFGLCVWCCCKQQPGSAGEKDAVKAVDFLNMFRPVVPPLQFADSSLGKKDRDSAISYPVVRRFIPDSVFYKNFGRTVRPKCYAAGKVVVRKAETYLFLKTSAPGKKVLYIACFNQEDSFVTAMPLVIHEEESNLQWSASMDQKYTISVSRQRRDAEGRSLFKKSVYVFNEAGAFTLIMMESNEEKPKNAQIINPIDTVSRHHKFTGDYLQDKRNFISFRDARNPAALLFFVHFEKDDGACKGELKGEAKMVSPVAARFTANGDPCSILFTFAGNTVAMKELEGCGSHRDIKCYFNGTYEKQKEIKKPKAAASRPNQHKIK
jgi:hypothetical protein